jgi:hypothetical protein
MEAAKAQNWAVEPQEKSNISYIHYMPYDFTNIDCTSEVKLCYKISEIILSHA